MRKRIVIDWIDILTFIMIGWGIVFIPWAIDTGHYIWAAIVFVVLCLRILALYLSIRFGRIYRGYL